MEFQKFLLLTLAAMVMVSVVVSARTLSSIFLTVFSPLGGVCYMGLARTGWDRVPICLPHPFATSFRFEATILDLEDVSYQHASHAAVKANPNSAVGETHFNLKIVSPKFEGLNLVKRHRLVYDALADELQSGLHALSIVAKTPQELESQPKRRPK
ncbi:hypothetical protein FEM48_Zijuj03G0069200 [Ziziphus jujuba var. spinosa]|uniref:SufE-like protein 1, chloroplastic/mitochondrial n=1 Tax=Ziziphus jujuba var. spinosa TaxID=714518 RepID=A0A978VNU2_ZIZJJ|nr:hypothetical protein FEM48_Zijuj03G0069200 [Ziziphus jujuba var. spinosa]